MKRPPDFRSAAARRRFHPNQDRLQEADGDSRVDDALRLIGRLLTGCRIWEEDALDGVVRCAAYQRGRLQITYAFRMKVRGRRRSASGPLSLDVSIGHFSVLEARWDKDGQRHVRVSPRWYWIEYLRKAHAKDAAALAARRRLQATSK